MTALNSRATNTKRLHSAVQCAGTDAQFLGCLCLVPAVALQCLSDEFLLRLAMEARAGWPCCSAAAPVVMLSDIRTAWTAAPKSSTGPLAQYHGALYQVGELPDVPRVGE